MIHLLALIACAGPDAVEDSGDAPATADPVAYTTYEYDCGAADDEWITFIMPAQPLTLTHFGHYPTTGEATYWSLDGDFSWTPDEDVSTYLDAQCTDGRLGGRVVVAYLPE